MRLHGLRLAIAMFTAAPIPSSWHEDVTRERATSTVLWLPFVGAVLGALAGLPVAAVIARDHGAGLLAATLGIGTLALLSRGLHLDGLADTADGLGSRAPAPRALEIMRRSDIGPFGVVALLLVLLVDVAALASAIGDDVWRGAALLAVAAATGRTAVVHAAVRGVRPARPNGFGALAADSTGRLNAAIVTTVIVAFGGLLGAMVGGNVLAWPVAQLAALALATILRRHASRRFGGVTGDVFGALVEITTALTMVGLVLA
jgi:adenosylcobinamide-GDP ribazoletransferase